MNRDWLETERAQLLYIIANARHKPTIEQAAKDLVEVDKKLKRLDWEIVHGATLQ